MRPARPPGWRARRTDSRTRRWRGGSPPRDEGRLETRRGLGQRRTARTGGAVGSPQRNRIRRVREREDSVLGDTERRGRGTSGARPLPQQADRATRNPFERDALDVERRAGVTGRAAQQLTARLVPGARRLRRMVMGAACSDERRDEKKARQPRRQARPTVHGQEPRPPADDSQTLALSGLDQRNPLNRPKSASNDTSTAP